MLRSLQSHTHTDQVITVPPTTICIYIYAISSSHHDISSIEPIDLYIYIYIAKHKPRKAKPQNAALYIYPCMARIYPR